MGQECGKEASDTVSSQATPVDCLFNGSVSYVNAVEAPILETSDFLFNDSSKSKQKYGRYDPYMRHVIVNVDNITPYPLIDPIQKKDETPLTFTHTHTHKHTVNKEESDDESSESDYEPPEPPPPDPVDKTSEESFSEEEESDSDAGVVITHGIINLSDLDTQGMFTREAHHQKDGHNRDGGGDLGGGRMDDPKNHTVGIRGITCEGETLSLVDHSPLKDSHTNSYKWTVSTTSARHPSFPNDAVSSTDTTLVLDSSMIGLHVRLRCTRTIEKTGGINKLTAFDPLTDKSKTLTTHTDEDGNDNVVQTEAFTGPILISDAWANLIVVSLSKGAFSCAVRMKDDPRLVQAGEVTEEKIRIGGTVTLQLGSVLFEWEAHTHTHTHTDDTQDEPETEFLDAEFDAKLVQFLPSRNSKMMVMMDLETELPVRFDVDPSVGRDKLLYLCLAFQANRKRREKSQFWKDILSSGESKEAKKLVQDFLHSEDLGL
eukprot:GHVR01167315.1.p1 GENE.GHVR01167315.1~~GHVR01167315.1.p1  ORF type:complete len:487 (-),score=150.75 GHVR01167315.1:55-1515(-)